jgi:hypothetical protein
VSSKSIFDDIANYCGYCDNGRALPGSKAKRCKGCGRENPTMYPELDKMKAAREKSAVLTEFVDWLDQNNMRICLRTEVSITYAGSPYEPIPESFEKLFARFFGIDLDKVEEERRQILDEQRKINERNG